MLRVHAFIAPPVTNHYAGHQEVKETTMRTETPQAPTRQRVCSGACPFFTPEYDRGRKIAGIGRCEKHDSQLRVQVGDFCLWTQPSLSKSRHAEPPVALPN
jgi:hypothetical protein